MENMKKIFVVTKEDGTIVGAYRINEAPEVPHTETLIPVSVPIAGPGQLVHEIEAPLELRVMKDDPKEFLIALHAHMKEGIPKDKVQEMYALAKEMKEKAHVSSKTVVMQQPVAAPVQEDPVAKLKQLKDILDAGLIAQDEYDKTKGAILARM